jgi:hypothetical protein
MAPVNGCKLQRILWRAHSCRCLSVTSVESFSITRMTTNQPCHLCLPTVCVSFQTELQTFHRPMLEANSSNLWFQQYLVMKWNVCNDMHHITQTILKFKKYRFKISLRRNTTRLGEIVGWSWSGLVQFSKFQHDSTQNLQGSRHKLASMSRRPESCSGYRCRRRGAILEKDCFKERRDSNLGYTWSSDKHRRQVEAYRHAVGDAFKERAK